MNNLTSVIIKNSKRKELTNRNAFLAKASFIIVFGFLAIIMIIFSRMATIKLAEINQSYAFINMLLFLNFILVFGESIFQSINTLYFSNDLKIFLRLPIKPKDLVHSKMIEMITSEYQMEILMFAIPMIVYGIISEVAITFYLYMIVILLILSVIPITFSTLIVSIIMRATNSIKNKNKAMYITIILAFLIVGLCISNLGTQVDTSLPTFERLILQTNGIAEELSNRFILIKPSMNVLLNYDNFGGLINLLIYVLESVIFYKIVVFIVSKIYLKGVVGTILSGQKNKKTMKKLTEKDLKKRNVRKTYIIKELKTIFRTPIFFIQCILMPIVDTILVVAIVLVCVNFAEGLGVDIIELISKNLEPSTIYSIFLALGQVIFMLNFSSIIAVSKEKKSAIMLKTLPIALDKQFKLKTYIGTITNMIPNIVISVGYYYFANSILYTIILFIGLILINIIGEKYKILIDLNNPQIKWNTEYIMMKQNTNVMYELVYTVIVIFIMIMIGNLLNSLSVFSIIMIVLLVGINLALNKYISSKQSKIFGKLY